MKKWLKRIIFLVVLLVAVVNTAMLINLRGKVSYCLFNIKVLEDAFIARDSGIPEEETLTKLTTLGDNKSYNDAAGKSVRNVYASKDITFEKIGLFSFRVCVQHYVLGESAKQQ